MTHECGGSFLIATPCCPGQPCFVGGGLMYTSSPMFITVNCGPAALS